MIKNMSSDEPIEAWKEEFVIRTVQNYEKWLKVGRIGLVFVVVGMMLAVVVCITTYHTHNYFPAVRVALSTMTVAMLWLVVNKMPIPAYENLKLIRKTEAYAKVRRMVLGKEPREHVNEWWARAHQEAGLSD